VFFGIGFGHLEYWTIVHIPGLAVLFRLDARAGDQTNITTGAGRVVMHAVGVGFIVHHRWPPHSSRKQHDDADADATVAAMVAVMVVMAADRSA
jgi:hypothetical protein